MLNLKNQTFDIKKILEYGVTGIFYEFCKLNDMQTAGY